MSLSDNKAAAELRRLAEKRLQKNKQIASSPTARDELQRLVHELEVHQIELEMQNEQLQQAQSELEEYLNQYTDLYDFAPVGYFTLGRDGSVLKANLTGTSLLGLERARLLRQRFGRFVTAEYRPAFNTFLRKVFQNQSAQSTDMELQREGSGNFFVHVEARVLEDGQECRIVVIDITAQKKAEELLRESEQKYRTLYETMSQGVVHQESDGKIISANPAAERILGLSEDQMKGKTSSELYRRTIHEDGTDFPVEAHPSMVAIRTGKAVHNVIMGLYSAEAKSWIWLKVDAVPLFIPGKDKPNQVCLTFEDITLHRRMMVYNKLTPREKDVFRLFAKGLRRKLIADILNISPKTVDKHRENLMEKLNLYTQEGVSKFARLIR